ncbi:MAG TPA: CdaR family protein [Thermoclostridium sp.]
MNKKISLNKFLEKDSVLKVISVLIGILIWFIVLDHQNPLSERTISIPLRSNSQVLDASNIRLVSSTIPTNVDVVIKGRKQRLDKVTANDFEAFLDFSEIQDTGTTELMINLPKYTGDQDIIVADVNPKVVKVKLENIIRKEFPINVKWVGELPEGYEVVNVKLNPNTVILQDLESVMNSVESVAVSVDTEQILKGDSINKRIEVYNNSGKIISSLDGSVQISVGYNIAKTVPISTTLTGEPKNDYYVQDYTISQNTVKIMGSYDVLKDIEYIEAEQLSVENVNESFQKDLNLILPENVQLYNSPGFVTAQVNIHKYSHRIITIPKSSITIFGGDVTGQTNYRILEDEITFSVKGPAEILDTLDVKSIKGFVDVSNTAEGVQLVIVRVSLPSGIYMEGEAFVNIQAEPVIISPTPSPTPVPDNEIDITPSPVPESDKNEESQSDT